MATAQKVRKKNKEQPDSLFDRVPPQSLEAEMAVLGSVMIDNDCIGKIFEIVDTQHFYRAVHQQIFMAARTLYEKNEPVDLITLTEELKRSNKLDEVGGAYYLTELAETIPSSANVEYHARIVLERFLMRRLIEESAAIAKECYDGIDDVYEIIDRSEQRIFGLSEKRQRRTFQHISPIMHEAFETIEKFHQREGVVTGILIGRHTRDDATLAVIAAGNVPYFSRRYSLDLLGKSDPAIARLPANPVGYAGHAKVDPETSLGRMPDLVVTLWIHGWVTGREIFKRDDIHSDYNYLIVRSESFQRLYLDNPVPLPYTMSHMSLYVCSTSPELTRLGVWEEPSITH